jgi:hypothetical protein
MRSVALISAILLASCATTPPVVHGQTPGYTCDAEGTARFIGQSGSSETGAAIMRATHSAVLRWAPPGVMLTMDFSPSRVTVRLGPDGKITAVNCG